MGQYQVITKTASQVIILCSLGRTSFFFVGYVINLQRTFCNSASFSRQHSSISFVLMLSSHKYFILSLKSYLLNYFKIRVQAQFKCPNSLNLYLLKTICFKDRYMDSFNICFCIPTDPFSKKWKTVRETRELKKEIQGYSCSIWGKLESCTTFENETAQVSLHFSNVFYLIKVIKFKVIWTDCAQNMHPLVTEIRVKFYWVLF